MSPFTKLMTAGVITAAGGILMILLQVFLEGYGIMPFLWVLAIVGTLIMWLLIVVNLVFSIATLVILRSWFLWAPVILVLVSLLGWQGLSALTAPSEPTTIAVDHRTETTLTERTDRPVAPTREADSRVSVLKRDLADRDDRIADLERTLAERDTSSAVNDPDRVVHDRPSQITAFFSDLMEWFNDLPLLGKIIVVFLLLMAARFLFERMRPAETNYANARSWCYRFTLLPLLGIIGLLYFVGQADFLSAFGRDTNLETRIDTIVGWVRTGFNKLFVDTGYVPENVAVTGKFIFALIVVFFVFFGLRAVRNLKGD